MLDNEIKRPSIRVPNPYEVFRDDPERMAALKEVEDILTGIKARDFGSWNLDLFFRNRPEMESFIKSPHPDLGNETPLELLAERVDVLGIRKAGQIGSTKTHREYDSPRSSQAPWRGLAQLSVKDDLASLSSATTFVHLSSESITNKATIRQILDLCPNLKRIQVPPSFRRIAGPGIKKMLIVRGIELVFGRMSENVHYDEPFSDNDTHFKTKKESFTRATRDPRKSQEISWMIRYELVDYEIARKYFGKVRVSMRRIAEEMGLAHVTVQRRILAICHWAGYPSKQYEVLRRARNFSRMLTVLKNAEGNIIQRQRLRESYAVGDVLPPNALAISRWEMWQKVYQLYLDQPRLIETLQLNHPDLYTALVSYFQLFGYQPETLQKLGETSGVTREAIRQRKNRALAYLDIVED